MNRLLVSTINRHPLNIQANHKSMHSQEPADHRIRRSYIDLQLGEEGERVLHPDLERETSVYG